VAVLLRRHWNLLSPTSAPEIFRPTNSIDSPQFHQIKFAVYTSESTAAKRVSVNCNAKDNKCIRQRGRVPELEPDLVHSTVSAFSFLSFFKLSFSAVA